VLFRSKLVILNFNLIPVQRSRGWAIHNLTIFIEHTVVARSEVVARLWATPLSMVFIDGGHTFEAVFRDYNCWVPHLIPGGYLVIHDIFSDPEKGGQAPYCMYHMALSSGLFNELPMINTLGILKRVSCDQVTVRAKQKRQNI
jgi:hypothetical protein